MPVAGDEGYETLIICPYDKAHEIRRGRMQFHLEKCRKNHLTSAARYEKCVLNSNHTIPSVEMEYHVTYECDGKKDWLRNVVQTTRAECPVSDLVPVNAGTVPEAEESWDDVEGYGSVLDKIKKEAAEKPILRLMQNEPKAKRKNFRIEEQMRHNRLLENQSTTSSVLGAESPILPKLRSNIAVTRQEPQQALQALNKVFKTQEEFPELGATRRIESPAFVYSAPSVASSYASASAGPSAATYARPSSATSTASSTTMKRKPQNVAMNIAESFERLTTNPTEEGFSTMLIPGRGRGRGRRLPRE